MSDAIHFYWDRRRTRRGAIVLLTIGAAGLLLLFQDGSDAKALGAFWLAAFTLFAAAVDRRGNRGEPVVTVSDAGIHDRRVSAALIAWEAISRIGGFEAENVHFIGLDFHNPAAALADAKPLVRFIAPAHRLLQFPSVSINTSLLDGSDGDLLAAIREFRPRLVEADTV